MKLFYTLCVSLLLLIAGAGMAQTSDSTEVISGEITYISADRIFGEPGSNSGLELGDTLNVIRGDAKIGSMVITAISSNSHSAQIVEQSTDFSVGDGLKITKTIKMEPEEQLGRIIPRDTLEAEQPPDTITAKEEYAAEQKKQPDRKTFLQSSGSVTLRYYGIFSNRSVSTFHQPAALIRWRGEEIGGSPLRFEFYGRAQKDLASDLSQRGGNRPLLRVYSAGFTYDGPDTDVIWQIGRVYPRNVSGMGTIDGVMYGREHNNLKYGVTAGFRPDYYNNAVNTEILKTGTYIGWSNGEYGAGGYSGVMAFVGQYRNGMVDREYFTLRQSYTPISSLRLSYVGDFTLDRNNNSDQIGFFTPSNSYLRLNWSHFSWMRLSLRYSYRKSIRLFATQSSIADSLYNYQSRQGMNGSIYFSLPWDITLYVSQNYRTHQTASKPVLQTSGALYFRDVLDSDIRVRTRYSHGSNEFSTTNNYSVSADRTLWNSTSVEAGYDLYQYTLRGRASARNRHNYNLDVRRQIFESSYFSFRYDYFTDENFSTQQVSASLSFNY